MAAEQVDHVLAGRGQRVVADGGDHGRDERALGPGAVLGVVVGPFEILDVRRDMDVGRVVESRLGRVEGRVPGRVVAGDVDLERGREGAKAAQVAQKSSGSSFASTSRVISVLAFRFEMTKGARCSSPNSVTTPVARPSLDQDLGDRAVGLDLEPEAGAGLRDRLGDRAHAALDEAPAAGPLMLAHQVVQEDVGGARRLGAGEGADRGVVGEHRLDHVALEPLRR